MAVAEEIHIDPPDPVAVDVPATVVLAALGEIAPVDTGTEARLTPHTGPYLGLDQGQFPGLDIDQGPDRPQDTANSQLTNSLTPQ